MQTFKNRTHTEIFGVLRIGVVGMLATLVGCSTMERSVLLGVGSGAAAGVGVGLMSADPDKGEASLIGAGVGAVVGGIASYLIHGSLEKRDEGTRRDTLFNLENHGVTSSSSTGNANLSDVGTLLTLPEVQEDWIETHAEGNKLVEGHRIYTITNGSRWDLNQSNRTKKRK